MTATYAKLVDRVRAQVREVVPRGARVLVVSRGDEALLRLDGRPAGHFPQSPTGLYAGHHPADGVEAAAHLAALHRQGAEYLVLPATASWWLEHYPELRAALEERGELLAADPETASVYALTRRSSARVLSAAELTVARTAPAAGALLRALLPDGARVVLIGPSADAVDLGRRPCHRLASGVEPVERVLERVDAAGPDFAVLLHPERPAEALDARLRRGLEARMARVCAQRLAEVFEARG